MEKVVGDWGTEVKMSGEEAKDVCRPGQGKECCAFLKERSSGFSCIRLSYPANSTIFSRLAGGSTNAGSNARGKGGWKGCAWPGIFTADPPMTPQLVRVLEAREKRRAAQSKEEPEDICGLCGRPGADKLPHPEHWPGEQSPLTELVHAECEDDECKRAHAALTPEQIRSHLDSIIARG